MTLKWWLDYVQYCTSQTMHKKLLSAINNNILIKTKGGTIFAPQMGISWQMFKKCSGDSIYTTNLVCNYYKAAGSQEILNQNHLGQCKKNEI